MNAEAALGVLLIGLGIGFLSGAFGKGGSAIATPLLHLVGVPAMVAVASPLPATIPSTFVASRAYSRDGHIDTRVFRLGIAIGLPATVFGALMTRWIPGTTLVRATDAIVLILGLRFVVGNRHERKPSTAEPTAPRVLAVAAVVGVVSGLLGNSGGFMLAPLFIAVLGMPVRRALGTSLALAGVLAVPGTVVHAWLGHIYWTVTGVFAVGAIPFALFGARAALQIKERSLTLAYGAGLAFAACGLLLFAR